jgi:hypothetical protein
MNIVELAMRGDDPYAERDIKHALCFAREAHFPMHALVVLSDWQCLYV